VVPVRNAIVGIMDMKTLLDSQVTEAYEATEILLGYRAWLEPILCLKLDDLHSELFVERTTRNEAHAAARKG
jgi:hypothetical protein